jgi:excisionase family DNA binding protein
MVNLTTTTRTHLTVEETADLLTRSRRTVYYWIQSGKIDSLHTPYGQRIPIAEVRRLANYLTQQHNVLVKHPAVERVHALSTQSSANGD